MPSFFIPYPPVLILSTGTNQTTSNASVTITSGIPPSYSPNLHACVMPAHAGLTTGRGCEMMEVFEEGVGEGR